MDADDAPRMEVFGLPEKESLRSGRSLGVAPRSPASALSSRAAAALSVGRDKTVEMEADEVAIGDFIKSSTFRWARLRVTLVGLKEEEVWGV